MATPPLSQLSDLELINQDPNPPDPYEGVEDIVNAIIRTIDIQERPSREVLVRLWKYLDLLWTGIFNYYWNSQHNQWRPITFDDLRSLSDDVEFDPSLLNKTINLIRPYGESLIGVLTTGTLRVKFFPADADNVDDIRTAKASIYIERKIADDNFMKVKIIEILRHLWNGGFAAAYNYTHTSPEYGQVTRNEYKSQTYRVTSEQCPECGNELNSKKEAVPDPSEGTDQGLLDSANKLDIDDDEANSQYELESLGETELPQELQTCPECQASFAKPVTDSNESTEQVLAGTTSVNKSRQLFKIYGPLNVKIPVKATCKDDVIWLILEEEVHEAKARYDYPDYWDKIRGGDVNGEFTFDRYARSQYENMGELSQYYATIRKLWLKPQAYPLIADKDKAAQLTQLYPKGLVAVYAGNTFLFCEESVMDDVWTLSFNPLYSRVYGDPLGKAIIPLQEEANELFQLEVETVKYAIPMTFADPDQLDFEAFKQSRAVPGSVTPMKAKPGQPLSNSMAETRTATLPQEVRDLDTKLERLLQFVSGVLPSVFGGSSGGSKTLGEYEQSRNQALQRLSLTLFMVNVMYAEMMAKGVKNYRENLLEDERLVEAKGDSFINVWIRQADLTGKVGKVIPEVGDQFPMSWAQKNETVMNLLKMNNNVLNAYLFHPENINFMAQVIGLDDLYVEGEDQRNKQLAEIAKMISDNVGQNQQPTQDPETGEVLPPQPNVLPIEPAVDDDAIHIAAGQAYLASFAGQELKESMPLAYQAIMMHTQEHQQNQQMIQMQQAEAQAAMSGGGKQPAGKVSPEERPIRIPMLPNQKAQ